MPDFRPADIDRLSLNQVTVDQWSLEEVIEGCGRAGIGWIGPWRHKVQEVGIDKAARMVSDSGLRVSSYCRGGFFPAPEHEVSGRHDDNRRAVDEAAELGTDVLVLVCGPSIDKDIETARRMVVDGIAELVPHARAAGVRLGIEPLHPMFAADRSVVVTLGQANEMASNFSSAEVGVIVDVYHVWWDPSLYDEIERAAGRILGFHVSDWTIPTEELLAGRGLMGDGVIELRRIRAAVEAAGYRGPIEVEIINRDLWGRSGDEVLGAVVGRFSEYV
ncbi:MAG: sugar phosphate isomerase/epimerase family protein [Actinomycetota bacterium]